MGASGNHGELVTHAHILLVGFVVSFVYAIIHRLWLENPARVVANVQFLVHQVGAVALSVGLFLIFGGFMSESKLAPLMAAASVSVLSGMALMIYMVVRFGAASTAPSR